MRHKPNETSILIYDIECDDVDVTKAKLKFFGYYSYSLKQTEIIHIQTLEDIDKVRALIDTHEVLVGFNNKQYDNPILERVLGIDLRFRIIVDMWEILAPRKTKGQWNSKSFGKGRAAVMKGFNPVSFQLDSIVQELGLGTKVHDHQVYKFLKQATFSSEELGRIVNYSKGDILITRNLFEYLYNYFYDFRDYVSEKDIKKFTWLTSSIASFAYKAICHACGLPEEYADKVEGERYTGAFISEPSQEKTVGKIVAMDFSSEYPHCLMMSNLYSSKCSCCKEGEKYKGRGPLQLKGKYCSKQLGKVENQIKTWYNLRLKYKKEKDPREYTIKILINASYGLVGNPVFKTLFDWNAASDCAYIGQQMVKLARQRYAEVGYNVIYSDTDSCYIEYDGNEERLLQTRDNIIKEIKSWFLFPQDTFNMVVDARIKALFFVKSGDVIKKKNYLFIDENDKIVIKGLPLIKSNATQLTKKLYNDYLKSEIIKNLDIKFNLGYLKQLVYEELKQDPTLISQLYKIKGYNEYKAKTSLHAQISQYLDGIYTGDEGINRPDTIRLIPNDRINLGQEFIEKGRKKGYCTFEDYKKFKLNVFNINIDKCLAELDPFIKFEQTNLGEWN